MIKRNGQAPIQTPILTPKNYSGGWAVKIPNWPQILVRSNKPYSWWAYTMYKGQEHCATSQLRNGVVESLTEKMSLLIRREKALAEYTKVEEIVTVYV